MISFGQIFLNWGSNKLKSKMKNPTGKQPRVGRIILWLLLPDTEREALLGDFSEIYQEKASQRGNFFAWLWYWGQILLLIPGFIKESITWSASMLKNYFKITFRTLLRQKAYSLINIAGLTIGMTCFILIFLFVRNEISFDAFHENGDRIYRIHLERQHPDSSFFMAPTMLPLAPALLSEFPEISYAVRFSQKSTALFSVGETMHYERLLHVDSDVFNIFTFPLLKGDPDSALAEPFSIVISEKTAEKYFGREDPIGRVIQIDNNQNYKITGILKNLPANSHLRFEVLASFSSLNNTERIKGQYWTSFSNDYTYVLLPEEVSPRELETKFPAFLDRYLDEDVKGKYILHFQALKDIHFSSLNYDFARTYNRNYLYAFSAIGFFILLMACINFMNLTTSRSVGRAKEIGVRKVVGAQRGQLIKQFLVEAVILSLLALVGAVILVQSVLPEFGDFINRDISFHLFNDFVLMGSLLGIALFVGLLSGSYPALYLSAFRPVIVLKGTKEKSARNVSFRTVFVVAQFAISIVLIISTLTVYQQLKYLKSKDLGFDQEQIVVVPMQGSSIKENASAFKAEVLLNPRILSLTPSNGTPASGTSSASTYHAEGDPVDQEIYLKTIYTDYDFVNTFGLEIIAGRNFSRDFSTDYEQAFILNETAVKKLGWDSPIGKRLYTNPEEPGYVIGVVKDFHYDSTQYEIEPMALNINPGEYKYISIKIRPDNVSETLMFLETKWEEVAPKYPFTYFFIDQEFETYYTFEQRLGSLFTYFAALAIFISCLGVIGLIAFTAEQSTKEIGVRKVLGASEWGIVLMLSKQFVKWVLIGNVIAWPVAYLLMNRWLQNFAYRTSLGLENFILSGFLAFIIAMLTISYRSVKAAMANPIDSLRYE